MQKKNFIFNFIIARELPRNTFSAVIEHWGEKAAAADLRVFNLPTHFCCSFPHYRRVTDLLTQWFLSH